MAHKDGWISAREAAPYLGVQNTPVVRSYMVDGRNANGVMIFLKFRMRAGKYYTREEWIDEFLEKMSEARRRKPAPTAKELAQGQQAAAKILG